MGKNGEPPITNADIQRIISTADEIAQAAKPKSKNIVADPVAEHGYMFEPEEPPLASIKKKIAEEEAKRDARVQERLDEANRQAKKKTWSWITEVS
jgi:hypothetical protein